MVVVVKVKVDVVKSKTDESAVGWALVSCDVKECK